MTIKLDTLTGKWHDVETGNVVESFGKASVPKELYDDGWRPC